MSRSSRSTLIALALAVLAVLPACTTAVPGSAVADPAPPPSEGPGSSPVAWADRLCGAVLSFAVPATAAPEFTTIGDLPAVQRTVSDYLGGVIAGVQQSRAQLAAVGRSPVAGGDEVVGRSESAMQFLEQDFTGAKSTVDGADPNDADAFLAALGDVETTLGAITVPDPLGDLRSAPRLLHAAERAAQCQQLSSLAAAAPR